MATSADPTQPKKGRRLSKAPPRQRKPLLVMEGVTKSYGEAHALGPVSLTVDAGERVALIGHNGSGKSTLLSTVAAVTEASTGRIEIQGRPPGDAGARAAVSYLPDTPVLYDDLSLREHLEYLSRLHGAAPETYDIEDLLTRFGLAARQDDLPRDYSRGLRQKAAISIAVCRPFSLLLIDEPFSGLDRTGKEALLELTGQVCEQRGAVVVATHDAAVLATFGRVIRLESGEIVYDGPPAEAPM